ncbi:MAG: formylglycine-generating enzyme family protein [Ferruginibacter sp.]|nr:formylglycine-generating enzyme family protein [Ferruginibacter sp.]
MLTKVLLILLGFISCGCLKAQDSVKIFSAYKFYVPGSKVQCKMVPISEGSFLMGSSENEKYRETDEGPQRRVNIAAFWMGAFEVTRDEFDIFYKDETVSDNSTIDAVTRPSPQYIDFSLGMGKEGGYPVNSLSQYAALMYCRWLFHKTGVFYRLPTEAEWEYACRAGSTTRFYFGDDEKQLDNYAWYKKNSENKFQKTGLKLPNAWGLFDMLGNVAEWTLDHYEEKRLENIPDNTKDPFVPPNKSRYPKVLRGGGYPDEAGQLRSADRYKSDPAWNRRDPQVPKSKWWLTDAPSVGFRIVCPLQQPAIEEANEFFKRYLGN